MVDNRSTVVSGIAGGINFKSGDISGTAAKTADDRASQGTEYFMQEGEMQNEKEQFVDRSMQLRASLNSLALLNFVSVFKTNKKTFLYDEDETLRQSEDKKTEEKKKKKTSSKKQTKSKSKNKDKKK